MYILYYCRHKSAGWEGVVYKDDAGKVRITNGLAIWDDSEKRRGDLEAVDAIDLSALCSHLARYQLEPELMVLLQRAERGDPTIIPDAVYLARPLREDIVFQISEESIDIRSSSTIFAHIQRHNGIQRRDHLLTQYQQVIRQAREKGVHITYTNRCRRTIEDGWADYHSAQQECAAIYEQLLRQARLIQQRGIHLRCIDDAELQKLHQLTNQYLTVSRRMHRLDNLESFIADHLASLQNADPSDGVARTIYL